MLTAVSVALSAWVGLGLSSPAQAATGYPVTTTLDGRTAKDMTNHAYPNKYAAGSTVDIACQDTGPVTYNGSTVWDYTADGLWVTDYYVKTGYNGFSPNLPRCDASNSPAAPNAATPYPVSAVLDGRTAKDMTNHAYPNYYAAGSTVNLVCQDTGPVTYSGSTVWDFTTEGLWVTDYYVKTGYNGFSPNLPRCADGGNPKPAKGVQFPVITTLDGRTAKDISNHADPDKYLAGSLVTVICQDLGPDAYGSTVWDYTSDSLWVTDKYVRTGFSGLDPQLTRCDGSSTPSQPNPDQDRARIVAAAQSQVGTYPEHDHDNCEPYYSNFATPYHCGEPWCAYFASWVWRTAGVWNTNFGGANQFYYWAAPRGLLRDFAHIKPGDAILYGSSPTTSVHIGLVEKVWPDGTINTIEGNWSDGVVRKEHLSPGDTGWEPIYAVVAPFNDGPAGRVPGDITLNKFPVTSTLDGRTAKDMSNHAYPDKYPADTVITVLCQDTGPVTYNGSTIWDFTTEGLWVTDYYVKTGFGGFDPDLQRCSPAITNPPPSHPKVLNDDYTFAYQYYFGTNPDLLGSRQRQATFGTAGIGGDTDIIIARAFIQGGDYESDWFKDHSGFSSDVDQLGRGIIAWDPSSGRVGLLMNPTCPGGVADLCKDALEIQNVGTTIPPGTECGGPWDPPVHPWCDASYDHNKVGVSGGNGAVFVAFQLANSYSSIKGAGITSPGAVDGYINMSYDSAGFHVNLTADQFPSWEIIRIPKYIQPGAPTTQMIGTRTERLLEYLDTNQFGQTTDRFDG